MLTRALALRPADRFGTPGAFADALVEASRRGEKLRDSEVREILERAAELEIAKTDEDVAHSIGAVEQIAASTAASTRPDRIGGSRCNADRTRASSCCSAPFTSMGWAQSAPPTAICRAIKPTVTAPQ